MADPAKNAVSSEKRRAKITDGEREIGFQRKKARELLNWNFPCTTIVLKDKMHNQPLALKPSRHPQDYSKDFLIVYYYYLI